MAKRKLTSKPKAKKVVKKQIKKATPKSKITTVKVKLTDVAKEIINMKDTDNLDVDIEEEITNEPVVKKEPKKEKIIPKYKRSILRQTSVEFNKKLEKIMNFIELPHIKQTYRLSSLVLHDGLLIYQGTRGNVYGIFRMKRYDSFVKFSIKKLFINTIGRYNLDIEEDYNV